MNHQQIATPLPTPTPHTVTVTDTRRNYSSYNFTLLTIGPFLGLRIKMVNGTPVVRVSLSVYVCRSVTLDNFIGLQKQQLCSRVFCFFKSPEAFNVLLDVERKTSQRTTLT